MHVRAIDSKRVNPSRGGILRRSLSDTGPPQSTGAPAKSPRLGKDRESQSPIPSSTVQSGEVAETFVPDMKYLDAELVLDLFNEVAQFFDPLVLPRYTVATPPLRE